MSDEALALVEVLRNSLVRMITERAEETHRFLRDHPQSALESCNRHSGPSMDVNRAVHVRSPPQDGAVQRKARAVDASPLVEVLIHIHLDKIGGRDLRPQQLVLLHQEFPVFAWNAHGAVVVNDIVPAMVRDEAIDRRELDAALPFRRRHRLG